MSDTARTGIARRCAARLGHGTAIAASALALGLTASFHGVPAFAQVASSLMADDAGADWLRDMTAAQRGAEGVGLRYGPRARASVQTSERPPARPAATRPIPRPGPESVGAQAETGLDRRSAEPEEPEIVRPAGGDIGDLEDLEVAVLTAAGEEAAEIVEARREPVVLRTADIGAGDFPMRRRESLVAVAEPGADAAVLLEHARILLAGMFLPEATRALEDAQRIMDDDDVDLQAQADELAAALEGLSDAVPSGTTADGPLWRMLQMVSRGDRADGADIARAAADLEHQSGAVASAALPVLANAAIRAGHLDMAGELIETGVASGILAGADLDLARGRLARASGHDEAAFDHLATAMATTSESGVRARIELVDLARSRAGGEALEQLRDILAEGVAQWRNDDLSRALMARLAAVTEDLGDRPGALSVMARLMTEHAESDEAQLARRRAPLLLSQMAREARDGRMDVESYIISMRDLEGALAGETPWIAARRDLAEILASNGLREAALAEYRAIRSDIGGGSPASARLRVETELREAELLLLSGRVNEARTALPRPAPSHSQEARRRQEWLSTSIDIAARETLPAAVPAGTDDEIGLQDARRASLIDQPEASAMAYEIYAAGDKELSRSDLVRYILANAEAERDATLSLDSNAEEPHRNEDLIRIGEALAPHLSRQVPLSSLAARDALAKNAENLEAIGTLLKGQTVGTPQ